MAEKRRVIPLATVAKVRDEYYEGLGSLHDLAAKHSLNSGTLENISKRERWSAHRTEYQRKKRELAQSPAPALLPVLNPPNGRLPEALPLDASSFAALNVRYHGLAAPILERAEAVLQQMACPLTPGEQVALATALRGLTQTAREILGIPVVAAIRRKETRLKAAVTSPIEPIGPADQPATAAV